MFHATKDNEEQLSRSRAPLFALIMLVIMLIVSCVSGYLFWHQQRHQEDSLAQTIGTLLSESINRISFSGKHHSRLLLEELQKRLPELVYISVESPEGLIIANTDTTKNGATIDQEAIRHNLRVLASEQPVMSETEADGVAVKEVLLPYNSGLKGSPIGIIRIGIRVDNARSEQRFNLIAHILLVIFLTIIAVWLMEAISRRFVRRLTESERKLRESNTLFTEFIRHSPIYAFIKEVTPHESRVLQASENYEDMVGIAGSKMLGKTMEELFPPEFAEKISADDWDVVSRGEVLRLDEDLGEKNYTTIKFPIALGDRTMLAGYTIDITERKQVENALREKSEELERYFALSLDLLCIANTEGQFLRLNLEWEKVLGYSLDELISSSFLDLIHPDDLVATKEAIGVLRQQQEIINFENRYRRKDGQYRWIEWRARPEGELVYAAARDVTERKKDEAERQTLMEQLAQAQKIESVGRLAGGVAHDFNNMLGVILGHLELGLKKVAKEHPVHGNLLEIQKAADRSASLTRQLLAFARKQTISPKLLDLNDTVASMLNMLRRLIGEHIELIWRPGSNLGPVKIDPVQIDQILANLCVNSRDAISDNGKIIIETSSAVFDTNYCAAHPETSPGEYLLLAISDNGSGMSKSVQANLFEPFFTTKGQGKGTGLGLATVYGIVRQNNGSIQVYSEPGHGTTFRIYLPTTQLSELEQMPHTERQEESLPLEGGSETLLLVEDEPMILDMTSRMLRLLGYSVIAVSGPLEAISFTEETSDRIDLLITDVVMPEMNGRELADTLSARFPGLRCLFMSGYTADLIAHHGVLEEGVEFIQKPFTSSDLAIGVRRCLDNTPAE